MMIKLTGAESGRSYFVDPANIREVAGPFDNGTLVDVYVGDGVWVAEDPEEVARKVNASRGLHEGPPRDGPYR